MIVCVSMLPASQGQTSTAPPTLPVYDFGACPGEYCQYREWTVKQAATVYDSWKEGRHAVAQLVAGDKVTGVTGVVITRKAGLIRMDRDLPEQHLKHGETILTYGFSSEGYSAVWFQGRYQRDYDISFTKWPDGSGCGNEHCTATAVELGKTSWWAQVKFASGRTGWVEMDHGKIQDSQF